MTKIYVGFYTQAKIEPVVNLNVLIGRLTACTLTAIMDITSINKKTILDNVLINISATFDKNIFCLIVGVAIQV